MKTSLITLEGYQTVQYGLLHPFHQPKSSFRKTHGQLIPSVCTTGAEFPQVGSIKTILSYLRYLILTRQIKPYLQRPIDRYDESDVVGGQTHRSQHDYHGYQSSLWNPGCPNTGCGGRDADRTNRGAKSECFIVFCKTHKRVLTQPLYFWATLKESDVFGCRCKNVLKSWVLLFYYKRSKLRCYHLLSLSHKIIWYFYNIFKISKKGEQFFYSILSHGPLYMFFFLAFNIKWINSIF